MGSNTATAMIIMAHPDDSFIFAHNIRKLMPMFQWLDICVTHTATSTRGREFKNAAKVMGSTPLLLGYEDDMYKPLERRLLQDEIMSLMLKYRPQMIVTHNSNGEYGHGHHLDVHHAVVDAVNTLKVTNTVIPIPIIVPSLNNGIADFITVGESKSQSDCLSIYEREMYMISNFDLYSEGYKFENLKDSPDQIRFKKLADYIDPHSVIYQPQQVINVDTTHA